MQKPIIGQILFSLNVGNSARYIEQKLTKVKVVSVGRKYFSTQQIDDECGYSKTDYHIDSWLEKTEYMENSCLYESELEYEQEKESSVICREISTIFEYGRNKKNLSLESLRKIKEIVDAKS